MAYNKTTGEYEGFIYLITNNVNGKQYVDKRSKLYKKDGILMWQNMVKDPWLIRR